MQPGAAGFGCHFFLLFQLNRQRNLENVFNYNASAPNVQAQERFLIKGKHVGSVKRY